jgi:hypothetical protein
MSDPIAQGWVEYEEEIIRAGQEACQRIGIGFRLSRVSWRKWSPFLRVSSDDPIFTAGALVLPWWMRGKLKPSEWGPLMASSLIYNRRLIWTMPGDLGLAILTLVVLAILGGGLVFSVFGVAGFWVYLLILFGPFLEQRTSQVRRNLKLKADFEASKLFGTGPFLSVLEKIDALGMKDMDRTKKRRLSRHFSSKPSLTERIQNLARS